MSEPGNFESNGHCFRKHAPEAFLFIARSDPRNYLLAHAFGANTPEDTVRELVALITASPDETKRGFAPCLSNQRLAENLYNHPKVLATLWSKNIVSTKEIFYYLANSPETPEKLTIAESYLQACAPNTSEKLLVLRHAAGKGQAELARLAVSSGEPGDTDLWYRAAWEHPNVLVRSHDLLRFKPADEVKLLRTLLTMNQPEAFKEVFVGLHGPTHLPRIKDWLHMANLSEQGELLPSYKTVRAPVTSQPIEVPSAPGFSMDL